MANPRARYRTGDAELDDAILELLQARWRDGDLNFAIELADAVLVNTAIAMLLDDDYQQSLHAPPPQPEAEPPGDEPR